MEPLIVTVALGVIVLLALVSSVVWLPDILAGRESVMATLAIRDGESVALTQRWAGDGYWTGVRHQLPSGDILYAGGDPDGPKAWKCRLELQTNYARVRIRFHGEG